MGHIASTSRELVLIRRKVGEGKVETGGTTNFNKELRIFFSLKEVLRKRLRTGVGVEGDSF